MFSPCILVSKEDFAQFTPESIGRDDILVVSSVEGWSGRSLLLRIILLPLVLVPRSLTLSRLALGGSSRGSIAPLILVLLSLSRLRDRLLLVILVGV